MSCAHGNVQRRPPVSRCELHIGTVADQKLDQFKIARTTALVQGGLSVRRVDVDVDRLQRGT